MQFENNVQSVASWTASQSHHGEMQVSGLQAPLTCLLKASHAAGGASLPWYFS